MNNIFPSLISADLLNLAEVMHILEPHCGGFHIDIMDFHFVPNLTWGPMFVNAIRRATKNTLWVHLMVDAPERYFDLMQLATGDWVTVHYEHVCQQKTILEDMRARGWRTGIAINPEESVEVIVPLAQHIDHVLLMSVIPGFSGQEFIPETLEKLKKLHEIKKTLRAHFVIAMDGGINKNNLGAIASIGVDAIAIANGIFGEKNYVIALKNLHALSAVSVLSNDTAIF